MRSIRSALVVGSAIRMLVVAGGSAWAGEPAREQRHREVDGIPFDQTKGNEPHGGTDFDGSLVEDLSGPIAASGVSAQPNQGFHVTLTVEAQGSIGAMTKHKTYWATAFGLRPHELVERPKA